MFGFGGESAKRVINLLGLAARKKPAVGQTPADVVFAENKLRLLRYRRPEGAPARYETPILLGPSLINRHYVMDLMPGKSMAEWLVHRGHDVFCIDWGTPGPEDRYVTFDDICDGYLGRAVRFVARTSQRNKAHLLGYCLGGTLAVIHTAARPERVASLGLLAAPVAFKDEGPLAAWTQNASFDPSAIVAAWGNAPWPLLQGAFHMLRPTLNLAKTVALIDRAWNDEFLDGFLALETWGNDNVSFPGECYVRYIEELYRGDALRKGTFTLGGKPALLQNVTCPLQVISFEHDNIVPKEAASALIELAGSKVKEHVHLPGGHVGAVVSRAASKRLWPVIEKFFAANDSRAGRGESQGGGARRVEETNASPRRRRNGSPRVRT